MATLTVQAQPLTETTPWSESARVWMFQSLFTNLCGMTFPDWWQTLRVNRFAVAPRYWHRAALVTAGSVLNSWYQGREERLFGDQVDEAAVHPPLFILGHWRSGTTLLHNLLALDDRYAFPNLYEVFFPHTFLCTEDDRSGLVAPLIPKTRVFDNVAQGFDMPNEDEFATAAASLCSPYMMWAFAGEGLQAANGSDVSRRLPTRKSFNWKKRPDAVPQKVTIRYERRFSLKVCRIPGRIKLLLGRCFPAAKFVHVHRDPYTVFRWSTAPERRPHAFSQFQRSDPDPSRKLDEAVIRRYRQIHDAYFDERRLIPGGDLHGLAFETWAIGRDRSPGRLQRPWLAGLRRCLAPARGSRRRPGRLSQECVSASCRRAQEPPSRRVAAVVRGEGLRDRLSVAPVSAAGGPALPGTQRERGSI